MIDNQLFTQLPVRLSLNQYKTGPYQVGCEHAATAAAGCGTVNLLVNGFATQINGQTVAPTVAQTAAEAGLHLDDRRTILGTRWKHDFGNNTVWRTQFVFDDRDINQPTCATKRGWRLPSYNVSSDLINRSGIFGFNATHLVGVFYNTLTSSSDTFNLKPGGDATLGRRSANVSSTTSNGGIRAREEIDLNRYWTVVAGADLETTNIDRRKQRLHFVAEPRKSPKWSRYASGSDCLMAQKERHLILTGHFPERMATSRTWRERLSHAANWEFVCRARTAADSNDARLEPPNEGYSLNLRRRFAAKQKRRTSMTGFYEFFEGGSSGRRSQHNLQIFTSTRLLLNIAV